MMFFMMSRWPQSLWVNFIILLVDLTRLYVYKYYLHIFVMHNSVRMTIFLPINFLKKGIIFVLPCFFPEKNRWYRAVELTIHLGGRVMCVFLPLFILILPCIYSRYAIIFVTSCGSLWDILRLSTCQTAAIWLPLIHLLATQPSYGFTMNLRV